MIRRTLLVCWIALLASVSIPNPVCADDMLTQQESEQSEGREQWRARLLAANQEVVSAKKRKAEALRAYEIMRHRRRPRGEGKQAIMDELEHSREELARAKQKLEQVEQAARHAGVPPHWMEFDPAELGAPASPKS